MPAQQIIKAADLPRGLPRRKVEGPIHVAILSYLERTLPHGAAATLHHSPNENDGAWDRIKAARLGTRPGWPDIEWHGRLDDGSPYSAKIEVKAQSGRLSDEQTACIDVLMDAGVYVGVARSIDEAQTLIRRWKLPSRDVDARQADRTRAGRAQG